MLRSSAVRQIPLVALEHASEFQRIASGSRPMAVSYIPVSDDESLPARTIFIEIADKSMSNATQPISFEPGDKVLIDLDAAPKPSEFVVALVPEEEAALFRLYREVGRAPDGTPIAKLVPLNPNFRAIRVSCGSGATIVGVGRRLYRIRDI